MIAKTNTPKTAAPSTPAAVPAGSPRQETQEPKTVSVMDPGADAEITAADIDAALGQLSDAPQADGNDSTPPEAETTDTVAEAEDAATNPPAESVAETEAGDAPEDATGDVETPIATAETAAPAAAAPASDDPPSQTEAPAPSAQKRINDLVARSKAAEADAAQARESLASLEALSSGRLEPSAFEHIDSLADLTKKRSNLVKLHQWALTHPQGGELAAADGKSAPQQYDAEGISQLLASTFELIHEALPAREQYLREREQADAKAVNAYPWLKDTRNEQAKQVQQAIEKMPAIRRLGPNYRIVAADALIGQTFREAGIQVDQKLLDRLVADQKAQKPGAAKAAVVPARKVPPPAPRAAGVVPARITANNAQKQSAAKRLSRGDGGINDLTASIAANL